MGVVQGIHGVVVHGSRGYMGVVQGGVVQGIHGSSTGDTWE